MQKRVPWSRRAQMLASVVLTSMLWGLETLPLTQRHRQRLDEVQRTMLHRMLRVARRSDETWVEWFVRGRRLLRDLMRKHDVASWSQMQKFRYLTWHGHVTRSEAGRLSRRACQWRNLEWWRARQAGFAHRGRQPGRHVGQRGCKPCVLEAPLERWWRRFQKSERYDRLLTMLLDTTHPWPFSWNDCAQVRELWRHYARWIVFKVECFWV